MTYYLKYALQAAVLWTIIIFILCCTPGKYIPSTHWLELLSFDKFVHASIFFILVNTWCAYCFKINKFTTQYVLFIVLMCILYGGLLEIMQATLFSQRSGDWLDFIANSFGCVVGYWFFLKQKKKLWIHRDYKNCE